MDQPRFRLLSHLFVHLTILPHSSAAVERVFSQVNSVKTKTTNRLNVDSVNKKLLAKQAVTKRGMNCTTWTPPLQLVKDVADGTCHKRYIQRMKAQQSENSVTVTVFEDSQNVPDSTPPIGNEHEVKTPAFTVVKRFFTFFLWAPFCSHFPPFCV